MKARLFALMTGAAVMLGGLLLASAACRRSATVNETQAKAPGQTAESGDIDLAAADPIQGGAKLWAENCMRCHNYREPRERSDREWEAIAMHMRIRANLPGEQYRLILRFLKSAN